MKITFKQFINERDTNSEKVIELVKSLLKSNKVKEIGQVSDKVIDTARSEAHRFVETLLGKYVVTVFNDAGRRFARVDPPRETKERQKFYVLDTGE